MVPAPGFPLPVPAAAVGMPHSRSAEKELGQDDEPDGLPVVDRSGVEEGRQEPVPQQHDEVPEKEGDDHGPHEAQDGHAHDAGHHRPGMCVFQMHG